MSKIDVLIVGIKRVINKSYVRSLISGVVERIKVKISDVDLCCTARFTPVGVVKLCLHVIILTNNRASVLWDVANDFESIRAI